MKHFVSIYFLLTIVSINNVLSKEDVLVDKIQQLTSLSYKTPVIRLNNERFKTLVKSAPRNYSVVVMFTALSPQRQCSICQPAHDDFVVLAESYRYSETFSNKLFFGMVDFDEGQEIFQQMKLNTAPVFIHFPAKEKSKKADQYDVSRWGISAEHMATWVKDRTEIEIQIFRPPNYLSFILIGVSVVVIFVFLYLKRDNLGFLYSNIVWGILAMGTVCYFISGQTWNFINNPPFISNRRNEMEIFANDSNMQYIVETYIVFLLYFGVCAGMILLNEAPKMRVQAGKRQTMLAILGILMVVFFFSYILSVFRAKYQGYPYSFLIK